MFFQCCNFFVKKNYNEGDFCTVTVGMESTSPNWQESRAATAWRRSFSAVIFL